MRKNGLSLVFLLLLLALPVSAQEQLKKILVLHSYHQYLPWTLVFQAGLDEARREYGNKPDYYLEYMDTSRLYTPLQGQDYARYLTYKYRDLTFDAVLGDSDEACLFLEAYGDFLGEIPRVYYTGDPLPLKQNVYSLVSRYDKAISETFRIAVEQNPGAQEILIITSEVEDGSVVENTLRSLLSPQGIQTIRALKDYSFDELFEEVRGLDDRTIILFTPVVFDKEGNRSIPKELLIKLAEISRAPIYTFWSSLMNSGAVGGYVIDGAQTAREMVRAVMDYLQSGSFQDNYCNLKPIFDWKALKKYNLNTHNLPEDTLMLNEPEKIFETHYKEILISIVIIILLFLALVLYWLRVVAQKNKQLREANRLITEAREEAEELARTDPMTGLLNRRAAMTLIYYEMNRQKRTDSTISLMVLDIDHFKQINDSHGHDTGDRVLKSLADLLTGAIRKIDTLARWGGEEFLMLLVETRGPDALILADKLRIYVHDLAFSFYPGITVSIGIAELSPGEDFDAWFKRADTALYKAKAAGRNSTVLATTG
ncbi:MAG: diguanylate cyclase [Spirochaetales bacterium]|nr:diguanylate cyclase [Spirochaetales bacterium]